ncbi:hypothetical protein FM112_06545 [Gulosibacter sp. 10]|nr:hypothetical protein FM112_06545 [Gulosibacter sp. 10]
MECADPDSTARHRYDTHFRLFVYEGPEATAMALDLRDTTIKEALENSRIFSEQDSRLWSLAVVDDGPGTGLIWISGMDYRIAPTSLREWRLRGDMQSRYLMARAQRDQPVVLPNGLRSIRMFPEWGVSIPLWESFTENYPVDPKTMPFGRRLKKDLDEWSAAWQAQAETNPEMPDTWRERGFELYERVQKALEDIAEVRPEF